MMNYALALRFPLLPLEALSVDTEKDAVIVVSSRHTVVAASSLCLVKGIEPGMPANTAELIFECRRLERNIKKEAALLTRICDALYAFTPYIQPYCANAKLATAQQGVLLELTRCIGLFKGLTPLLQHIVSTLSDMGLCFFAALAHSGKAAWLVSYQSDQPGQVIPALTEVADQTYEESIKAHVSGIQINHLESFPLEASALIQAGFESFSDLRRHIQKEGVFSLQKRFAPDFIDYLREVGGAWLCSDAARDRVSPQQGLFPSSRASEPRLVYEPEMAFTECMEFDWPLSSIELLYAPMQNLLQGLCDYLLRHQLQCCGVTWRFSDIYQNRHCIPVRCERVYRDWSLLYELSLIQLEAQGLPFEINLLELTQPLLSAAHFEEGDLATDDQRQRITDKHVQRMLARIQARVGEKNVFKLSMKDEHVPELAQQKVEAHQPIDDALSEIGQDAERPTWLLNKPVVIGKHQNHLFWHGRIQLIRGPEKIAAHWWDTPVERDYFTAVREDHVRLWVFYDALKSEWCVQGVF